MIGAFALAAGPGADASGVVFVFVCTTLLGLGLAAYVRTGWLQ